MENISRKWLNELQASEYLGISRSALRMWRVKRIGPAFYRAGSKAIRYRRDDLDRFLEDRKVETVDSIR